MWFESRTVQSLIPFETYRSRLRCNSHAVFTEDFIVAVSLGVCYKGLQRNLLYNFDILTIKHKVVYPKIT